MPWALTKKVTLLLSVCLAALVAVVFSVQIVSADAITGQNNDGLESKTERWLRLRAIAKCFDENDIGKNSYNKVASGDFFGGGDVAIGYLNEDGKVSCEDDAFVSNTFSKIGFASNVEAFCSVQPMASRDDSDKSNESDFNGCVNGTGDQFDMDSDAFDQGARQKEQFKQGYSQHATGPVSWNPTPSIMYYVYKRSLVQFCGATFTGVYNPADKNNVDADKRKVVVNDIDLATGNIVRNVYSLTRDQTDKIDDIYVNDAMQNVSNVSCSQMAQKTWDYDKDMAAYVKAYIDSTGDQGTGTVGNAGDGTGNNTDQPCSAGALGWVLCPLSEAMVSAIEGIAGILQELLIFQPLTTSDQGTAIRTIWSQLLGIANAGLAIAFLVVIFSQATSIGLSSYGIKKLLPRVVAAAILMNLSFYICAAAVDISNILGVSIKSITEAGISQVATSNKNLDVAYTGADGWQWAGIIAAAVLAAGVAAATGAIFLLIPVLVAAFMAILTALIIIAARQVLITLLIIVAPLAILAWILPNTEDWFTKWRKLFTILLLMFPMIMAIFYGSVLVSNVILVAGTKSGSGLNDFTIKLLAFLVLIVPLFSLPFVIKSVGGILDRLGVLVNNRNRGLVDRARKKSEEWKGNSAYQRSRTARRSETQARRSRDFYEAMASEGRKGLRKRALGRAGYTTMGATYLTKGGRLDARRTSDNIADQYRKQQTEATQRALAGLVEGGAFSQGSSYRIVGSNGAELMGPTANHREMVPQVLRNAGATLEVTDAAGKTRQYRTDDIGGAVMSKTAQMGDVPLTDSVLQMGGETAAGMREFISYNAGNYASKAPDYIKGAAGAFNDPKAAEVVGWHAATAGRAAAHANQTPEAAANIAAALNEALNNENLRGDLTTGSVQNLIGQENTAIWSSLSPGGQQAVRDFLQSHANPQPNPNPGGGGNPASGGGTP